MLQYKLSKQFKKIGITIIVLALPLLLVLKTEAAQESVKWWQFQSIDTMKYSRDPSREKLNDPEFDKVIDRQVKDIADAGANYVAIATPYDDEFLPILKRWVSSARKYDLKVWFRGNWSGWEKWFDYPPIDRAAHIAKTQKFILDNRGLFEDGDIFSACPECENGGPGDPRSNGDVLGHRKFLLDEYQITKEAFAKIGKKVASNYNSMNGDVARLVMNKETTQAMDGVVVIDHYVSSPEQLAEDVAQLTQASGGKVILGEFGAPINDLTGELTEGEQAEWINKALTKLVMVPELKGLNYWVNVGGSTRLWNNDGTPRKAVEILKNFYQPLQITGTVKDESGSPISKALVEGPERAITTDSQGYFSLPHLQEIQTLKVTAAGYLGGTIVAPQNKTTVKIVLKKEHEDLFFRIKQFLRNLLHLS